MNKPPTEAGILHLWFDGNWSALGILTVQATRHTLIHRPSRLEAARLPQRPCLRRPKLKASGRGGGEARGGGSRRRRRPWLKDRFRARSGPARLRYIVVWAGIVQQPTKMLLILCYSTPPTRLRASAADDAAANGEEGGQADGAAHSHPPHIAVALAREAAADRDPRNLGPTLAAPNDERRLARGGGWRGGGWRKRRRRRRRHRGWRRRQERFPRWQQRRLRQVWRRVVVRGWRRRVVVCRRLAAAASAARLSRALA